MTCVEFLCGRLFLSDSGHMVLQDVNMTGWWSVIRSLFGYHCHELPAVLMSSERVENLLSLSTNWEVVENYDMEHILPHVGGAAFVLFLTL